MNNTYLTTEELAARIKYDARTIRNQLKDSVLLEGVHYIRPFGGRKMVEVCGVDVGSNSSNSRRKVGYLPEHNPLYPEMYISEYLRFVAGI